MLDASRLPLFWRVYATHAAALLLAAATLVVAPVTVSVPASTSEFAVLLGGFSALLTLTVVVLRPAFRPFGELTETMLRHDPLSPAAPLTIDGDPDVVALTQARELHDEIGQTLTGVMLQIEGLAGTIPDSLRRQLDELRDTARFGTDEVKRIASHLRPEALEALGLQSALAALATTFAEQLRIAVTRRLDISLPLSEEQELVVYRVAQEALTNVARHAEATRVELRLEHDDEKTMLTVRDDGRGLPADALSSSNGIRGMRERAIQIGAELAIGRTPRRGTQVTLTIATDRPAH